MKYQFIHSQPNTSQTTVWLQMETNTGDPNTTLAAPSLPLKQVPSTSKQFIDSGSVYGGTSEHQPNQSGDTISALLGVSK